MKSIAKFCSSLIVVILIVLLMSARTAPQQPAGLSDYEAEITTCRSYYPATKFPNLPPAILMDGIGNSHLKITTKSEEAQKFFDQGINHLHSFWDVEAYRAFKEVIRLDSTCAMGYWGLYNSITQTAGEIPEEKKAALDKAVTLGVHTSDREQRFIKAAQIMSKEGKQPYINEMEALIDAYPQEVEAQLFLATALSTSVHSYDPEGRPRPGKVYGQTILKNLLAKYPDLSAAHHYWIHAVENGPHPELALESAKRIVSLAPNSGHITHMPGHIYYRMGKYTEAIDAFLYSMKVDSLYMETQKMSPINNWNYTHNLDYLVAACAENGRYTAAMKWAEDLMKLPVAEDRLMSGGLSYILFGAHTAVPRLQIRFQKWKEAAESMDAHSKKNPNLTSMAKDYYAGIKAYSLGMYAVTNNKVKEAEASKVILEQLLEQLKSTKPALGSDWYFGYALKILQVNVKELNASILSLKGSNDEALKLLKEAADDERKIGYWEPPHYTRPVYETLGQTYARAGNMAEAEKAFNDARKLRPNSGHPLLELARAYKSVGMTEESKTAYRMFLDAWSNADQGMNEIREARSFIKKG